LSLTVFDVFINDLADEIDSHCREASIDVHISVPHIYTPNFGI